MKRLESLEGRMAAYNARKLEIESLPANEQKMAKVQLGLEGATIVTDAGCGCVMALVSLAFTLFMISIVWSVLCGS